MNTITRGLSAAAALTAFGITGWAAADDTAHSDNSEVSVTDQSPAADDANGDEANPEPEVIPEPDAGDMTVPFGKTHTWEDNLSVTIAKPVAFTGGAWTSGGEGYPHLVKFAVTVQNDSAQPVDLSLFDYEITSNGTVGETDVIDDDEGVDLSPNASVMPGKSMTFTLGAAVQGLNNLTVLAAPNWEYQQLAFGA